MSVAEFRGPGVRQSFDQESPDDYDLDIQRYRGGRNGRIILLGDGSEKVLTDATEDSEMFDHSMDDASDEDGKPSTEEDTQRRQRQETPGPEEGLGSRKTDSKTSEESGSMGIKGVQDTPDSKA